MDILAYYKDAKNLKQKRMPAADQLQDIYLKEKVLAKKQREVLKYQMNCSN